MANYTVIIATHDRPSLLARAIRSVHAQGLPRTTVIVVSDTRSAETCAAARTCLGNDDLYLERSGDAGPAQSRTLGLMLARSDYVMFLDDDDEFAAGCFAAIDNYTTAAGDSVLYCDFSIANDGDDRIAPPVGALHPVTIGLRSPDEVYVRNFIPNSCLVYPIAAVRGRTFDASLVLNEDWDFLLNVMQNAPLLHIPISSAIIHKTPADKALNRRGLRNNHLLPDVIRTIYRKWPAPTEQVRQARQRLFASIGLLLPTGEF